MSDKEAYKTRTVFLSLGKTVSAKCHQELKGTRRDSDEDNKFCLYKKKKKKSAFCCHLLQFLQSYEPMPVFLLECC
jgi:hypothetical protein